VRRNGRVGGADVGVHERVQLGQQGGGARGGAQAWARRRRGGGRAATTTPTPTTLRVGNHGQRPLGQGQDDAFPTHLGRPGG